MNMDKLKIMQETRRELENDLKNATGDKKEYLRSELYEINRAIKIIIRKAESNS